MFESLVSQGVLFRWGVLRRLRFWEVCVDDGSIEWLFVRHSNRHRVQGFEQCFRVECVGSYPSVQRVPEGSRTDLAVNILRQRESVWGLKV